MCGITGFFSKTGFHDDCIEILRQSINSLVHRGPDDSGVWCDQNVGIAMGHRRLSVLDLSPTGHQPMHSQSGRFVIVFNGEIYNFTAIRKDLERQSHLNWRGTSDTEVILAAVEQWGLTSAVQRFIGMFAFAIWDKQEKELSLVRDRIGEKPLYYGWCGTTFLYGSELKSLKAHPSFNATIDRNVLGLYLRHNCIPAPHSIYTGIRKLIPGTILTISLDNTTSEPVAYWSARNCAEQGLANPFSGTEQDAVESLEALLHDAVGKQMIADVPLGAFLSGGIDSSIIVALMQSQSCRPVKTFTIGFTEAEYNEAMYARTVAHHLGTDHIELYVSPTDAMDVIPRLPILYDEPFSDSSQIPTFLVSQLTRQHVAVALSGDAGDELFGGYNRYFWWKTIWNKISCIPKPLRNRLAGCIKQVSPVRWDNISQAILFQSLRPKSAGDKVHKIADILDSCDPMEMYYRFVSHLQNTHEVAISATEPLTLVTDRTKWITCNNMTEQMMFLDLVTYLPDDILVKVDRAAMGVSLETRVPFLDHRLIEFAWQLPMQMKIRDGRGKWILRKLLGKYIPKEMIDRPKTGFGVPIVSWLRGPLREWAEALLNEHRLREEGFFNPAPIRKMWREHLQCTHNWQYHLWDILMFQAWLENDRS